MKYTYILCVHRYMDFILFSSIHIYVCMYVCTIHASYIISWT